MRHSHRPLLFFLPLVLISFVVAAAQTDAPIVLQVGTPIERTLGGNQSHSYTVALDQNQYLQLVVEQHGIDVIVRVVSPSGKKVGEFDSPNGDDGPENVSMVAMEAGNYRIQVAPLDQTSNPSAGKYEIKITEIRKATEEELRAGNQQEQLKPKGRALVVEAIDLFPQVHRPDTRARFQLRAGRILWDSDQKRAAKLLTQAIESIKEFIGAVENSDQDYSDSFQNVWNLREEMVTALTPLDPEMALDALRSTRGLANPEGNANQQRVEQQLEVQLISQLAAKDPRRSFQMAEDSLKTGTPDGLIAVVYQISARDQELASRLAHDIVAKVLKESFMQNAQAGNLAVNLMNIAHQPLRNGAGVANNGQVALLSADDIRDLVQKMVAEALAYEVPKTGYQDEKRNLARQLINTLERMTTDLQAYAGDKKQALDDKLIAVQTTGNPQQDLWTKYQNVVHQGTPEAVLESIGAAPADMRPTLYEQLANRLAQTGDVDRGRLIITDKISNPNQRRQAMRNFDRQAIYVAINKGRIDEAIRILTNLRPLNERAQIIGDVLTRIGPGLKRAAAMGYLEQLGTMLDIGKAADQPHMFARLQLARAFARYDVERAFDLMDPLLDQFNELAAAAMIMNGFSERYYRDGELITNNGNALANLANQMSTSLAGLALMNFDRARTSADRVSALDIRLLAYLTIAQQAMRDTRGGVVDF
jgi:hypothetical protein